MKTVFFEKVTSVTPGILKKMNVNCILLDIDNTIKTYGSKNLHTGVFDWMNTVKEADIKIILCSNNYEKNVQPFANSIGCDYISFCLKPSPFGYFKAIKKSKIKFSEIVVVGDQLFTDIFGGKILGLKTILVNPIDESIEGKTVKLRRALLKPITNKITKRENPFLMEEI